MKNAWIISVVALLTITGGCFAQQASIVGTVTDQSGAVIPHVKVTVQNPARGFTRQLTTNSAGAYVAASVPIGDYVITAEHPGFQRLVKTGIVL